MLGKQGFMDLTEAFLITDATVSSEDLSYN